LLDWLDEAQLDRVGCFQYSPVEGARANELAGAVPAELMQERWERFMEKAADISEARLQARVGQKMRVLVDEIDLETGLAQARSAADAPEIDGLVLIEDAGHLKSGSWAQVEIVAADTYDLQGRLLED